MIYTIKKNYFSIVEKIVEMDFGIVMSSLKRLNISQNT